MNTINFLADIWGISIVVISFALLIKDKHLKNLFAGLETQERFFEWGVVAFVIGLAMVLTFNVWDLSWQIIITLLGWLTLIKGLALLFMPDTIKTWAKKLEVASFLPYALVVLLIIGLILTYFGFTAA